MRKVILKMHVSIDGYIRGNNEVGVDWIFKTHDDELQTWEVDLLSKAGTHVMGKNLYDEMAAYWPNSTEVYAPPMNEISKVVFSKSMKHADWKGTKVINGDVAEGIAQLKEESGKDILVHGGAAFVHSLSKLGLIDEYRLIVHPIALGGGLPLFKEKIDMKLLSVKSFQAGVVLLVYKGI